VVQRREAVLALLVEQHRVALREGAALDVLPGQTDPVTLGEKPAEGERLRGRPIDALAGLDRLLAVVEEAPDRAVQVEALRRLGDFAPIAFSSSAGIPVLPRRASSTSSRTAVRPDQRPSSQSALFGR
jgi:hypothetical protein